MRGHSQNPTGGRLSMTPTGAWSKITIIQGVQFKILYLPNINTATTTHQTLGTCHHCTTTPCAHHNTVGFRAIRDHFLCSKTLSFSVVHCCSSFKYTERVDLILKFNFHQKNHEYSSEYFSAEYFYCFFTRNKIIGV